MKVTKEFYRNYNICNDIFSITIRTRETIVKREARNIFKENSFHLNTEFENELEKNNIDPYKNVLKLKRK